MTKTDSTRKILYSIVATIPALALITPVVETSLRSNSAEAVPAQDLPTPPGPVFPPVPEHTAPEKDALVAKAMTIPGIKAWSDKWQYNYVDFSGTSIPIPKWETRILHLYLPPDVSAPQACDIGWEAIVVFDLATGEITHSDYPELTTPCHRAVVFLQDPDAVPKENIESSIFLPTASAAGASHTFAAATQDDILNTNNVLKGTLADILTPAFTGQFVHMDGGVAQTVNARFSPTPGANYLQSGWVITHVGCTASCGDLVQPDTKVLIWADSSVAPNNNAAHVFGYPNPPA